MEGVDALIPFEDGSLDLPLLQETDEGKLKFANLEHDIGNLAIDVADVIFWDSGERVDKMPLDFIHQHIRGPKWVIGIQIVVTYTRDRYCGVYRDVPIVSISLIILAGPFNDHGFEIRTTQNVASRNPSS